MAGFLSKVLEARKDHPALFLLKLPTVAVFYRPLTVREFFAFDNLTSAFSPTELNEELVRLAVVSTDRGEGCDYLFKVAPAGYIDYIADAILKSSKFLEPNPLETELPRYRMQIQRIDLLVTTLVLKAFPGLTREDVNNCTYDELLTLLAMSESALGTKIEFGKKKRRRSPVEPPPSKRPSPELLSKYPELLSPEVADTLDSTELP